MNESRFHCEINSIKVEGMMVKFNIFGDTLTQVTADLEQVIDYVTGGAPASGSVPGAAKAPAKAAAQPPASKVGTCVNCGSDLLVSIHAPARGATRMPGLV